MCSPAAIPVGMMIVGTGMQAYGGLQSAKYQKEAGKASKKYYEYLAKQNESDAAQVLTDAETNVSGIQADASRQQHALAQGVKRVEGTQKATLAANGVPLDSVTAEDITRDTFDMAKIDAMAIRFNADSQSWATRKSASDEAKKLKTNAILNRMGGANAYQASRWEARSTLLGTGATVANNWAMYLNR